MIIQPTVLSGPRVLLEPVEEKHVPGLTEAGRDPSLWTHIPVKRPANDREMAWFLRSLQAVARLPRELPFATCLREDGRVVGTTSFLDIDPVNRSIEIGRTWIVPTYQRTFVNTEAKLLMLREAFETFGAVRVFLKTHAENARSRTAIERLGARFEGVLRKHMLLPDGSWRDTAYFSIIDDEWQAVKAGLEARLR